LSSWGRSAGQQGDHIDSSSQHGHHNASDFCRAECRRELTLSPPGVRGGTGIKFLVAKLLITKVPDTKVPNHKLSRLQNFCPMFQAFTKFIPFLSS
jgi:hypothetical protein